MKNAKVVEVRDLGPLSAIEAASADHDQERVDRMATLLRRYPQIEEAEKAELLLFLRHGPQLEIGLLSAREGMASRLMRFRRDHAAHFRPKPLQSLGFVVLVLGPLAALAWACLG